MRHKKNHPNSNQFGETGLSCSVNGASGFHEQKLSLLSPVEIEQVGDKFGMRIYAKFESIHPGVYGIEPNTGLRIRIEDSSWIDIIYHGRVGSLDIMFFACLVTKEQVSELERILSQGLSGPEPRAQIGRKQ